MYRFLSWILALFVGFVLAVILLMVVGTLASAFVAAQQCGVSNLGWGCKWASGLRVGIFLGALVIVPLLTVFNAWWLIRLIGGATGSKTNNEGPQDGP